MKKKTGIGFRIIIMAIVLSVIAATIGFVGLYTTKKVSTLGESMYKKNLHGIQYADDLQYILQTAAVTLLNANMPGKTAEEINAYKEEFAAGYAAFEDAITKCESTIESDAGRDLMKTIKESGKEYVDKGSVMFDYFLKGDLTGANKYGAEVLVPIRNKKLNPAVKTLANGQVDEANTAYASSLHIASLSVTIIIIAILIGLALSLTLGITITRSITKPVSKIVNNLSDSSGQIAISSTQLSESSQEIANGAQEQAASIEETTSSMEELSSMVKQNLGNTRQASLLSEKATEASQDGFDKMTNMLTAMNGISKSAEDIRNVIDVIDDIAFQTNMLALNAAVEAARAGEAGMGFAVVADEVKNLANRSSESAKETAAMIKETLKNVETGMTISKELSETFKEILTNSKKVMEMNREVETASGQQDEGISQVNKAMLQFDTVVQANASSAEETASAAEELQGQVGNLNEIVNALYTIVTGNEYNANEHAHIAPSHYISGGHAATSAGTHHVTTIQHIPAKASASQSAAMQGSNQANSTKKTALTQEPQKTKKQGAEKKATEHAISFEDDEDFKPS